MSDKLQTVIKFFLVSSMFGIAISIIGLTVVLLISEVYGDMILKAGTIIALPSMMVTLFITMWVDIWDRKN